MKPGDRDGDGIIDVDDLCPYSEEDLDSFEDSDGCPELDNDQDRILDVDDQCPGEGETYNGVDDGDGCPDRGRVTVSSSNIMVLDRIYFSKGSSEILAPSEPILDAVAATLATATNILLLEIQGHTAANEKSPSTLAEDRALAVASYLVKAGVEKSRLQVRAYGDMNPVDTKSTEEAHARNRRIEFIILKEDEGHYERKELANRKKPTVADAKRSSAATREKELAVMVPRTKTTGGMVHYSLPTSVSIANGESTLVPLINANVEGEENYLYRPDKNLPGSKQHPSRAVRVVNTGELALVPGPIAVFARDAFAGEGLLDSLSPSESAFIPFALDSSSDVSVKEAWADYPKNIISISEGDMTVIDEHELTTEYTVSAGLTPPKRVFVQHHGRVGFELTPPPNSEIDGSTVLAPLRLVRAGEATLRLRERNYDSRVLSLEHDSVPELREYLAASSVPSPQAKEIERFLQLRIDIELAEGTMEAKRSQRFDDRVRAYEIRMNLKALAGDQGRLRSSLKQELAGSEKRGRKLASEVAVLSEALTKQAIEFQSLLLTLQYKSTKP
jgi:outer membrane protein OmpA-like peptidoglycan-associated protein